MEKGSRDTLGSLTMRSDGILHVEFDFDRQPSQIEVDDYLRDRAELVGDRRCPVIIEIVHIPYIERGTRIALVQGLARTPASCRAVVATDPAYLTMFRSFLIVEPAEIPTQVFLTVASAVEWIHSETAAG